MTLIGYARVSAESQHVDLQKDTLRKAGCGRVFGYITSGAKKERQDLDAALAYLREGDALAVWKLGHLGRPMIHLVNTVQGSATCGVGLKVLARQGTAVGTTMTPGKLIFGVFAALAEFERNLIRERTKTGSTAAAVCGCKSGRKPIVIVDKLQRAWKHITNGLNVHKAATRLKVSKTALCAALQGGSERR